MDHSFSPTYRSWARWCLFNLLLVALAGLVIRSKIIFPLPFIQQKNLLHGHSHFAFGGWVSTALMTAIISILYPEVPDKKMSRLFYLQMIASYGMLLTFPFMGYKLPSIFFSTVTIVVSYLFCYYSWIPVAGLPATVRNWIRTALICNVFSSIGTFALAYLMATGSHSQELTIGSLYFFLHFQYNGWFFFSCAGLFFYWLHTAGLSMKVNASQMLWRLLALSVVPGFFLSTLWMSIPGWMYAFAVLAALTQLVAVFIFLREWMSMNLYPNIKPIAKYCMLLSLSAVTLKFILQLLSCISPLNIYAFGYRPLVIAFLHLVLLGFVSLFIVGYFLQTGLLPFNGWVKKGIYIFTAGIVLNEVLLILQGLGAIAYISIPYTNEILWGIAIIMVSGVFMLNRRSA